MKYLILILSLFLFACSENPVGTGNKESKPVQSSFNIQLVNKQQDTFTYAIRGLRYNNNDNQDELEVELELTTVTIVDVKTSLNSYKIITR